MIITLHIDAPMHMAQGVKEAIAMDLEKYGKVKVVEIREDEPTYEQIRLGGKI